MIDPEHQLPIQRQAKTLGIARSNVYYKPVPLSESDLAIMRQIDQLQLEHPFAGSQSAARENRSLTAIRAGSVRIEESVPGTAGVWLAVDSEPGGHALPAQPILYSFRRCPYAIRARMTLRYSGIDWAHREVSLQHKPAAMLDASPKGTVPVLILPDGQVLEESLDIMFWALGQYDPDRWLPRYQALPAPTVTLVDTLEHRFKPALDGFKYNNRGPQFGWLPYRKACESYLAELERALAVDAGLSAEDPGFADVALLPFVRQCASVDPNWFSELPHPRLQLWLAALLQQPLFTGIMNKVPLWDDAADASVDR